MGGTTGAGASMPEIRCEQCAFDLKDWRHTMLCGKLDEEQQQALAELVVLDAKARGELPQ